LGIPVTVVAKWGLEDGINAVRRILPKCWFDQDKCQEGIKALRQYRRKWDDVRKVFYEHPEHDWASDPADSFRYLAIAIQEPTAPRKKEKMKQPGWVV
jgi:phage terminase large subunit